MDTISPDRPAATAPGLEDDLGTDPFDDDLGSRLSALAPRRIVGRLTMVLASIALVTSGFVAGALVQQHYGTASDTTSQPGMSRGGFARGAFPSGMPGAGQNRQGDQGQGQNSNAAGSTTGTVKLVDGTTIYLQTSDGRVVTIKTNSSTKVRTSATASLGDLPAGTTVTVEGTTSGDTLTATTVTGQR